MSFNPLRVSLDNIIPLTEARDHFSQIVNEVQKDKLYVLTKGGKPAVAIVDVKYLEQITGGNVNHSHIENEIQKNPAKVGRPEMIQHGTPPRQNQTPPPAKPTPSPVRQFEQPKPATPPVRVESPKPVMPQQAQTAQTQAPKPTTPPIPTSFPPATPVVQPNNPSASNSTPVENKPLRMPNDAIETSFSNNLPSQPIKPKITTPTATPVSVPTPAPTPAPAPAPKPATTIDVQPITDSDDEKTQNTSISDNSQFAPEDRPGPAQYSANSAHDEPDDMLID